MKLHRENMVDLINQYLDFDGNRASDGGESYGYLSGLLDTVEYLFGAQVRSDMYKIYREILSNNEVNK